MLQGTESVTIVRRTLGAVDDYGVPTESVTNIVVDRVLVGFGSSKQPASADEDPQNTQVTLYFPNGTVIESDDEFIIRDTHWVKDGRAQDWIAPFGSFAPGVVVDVRQRLG